MVKERDLPAGIMEFKRNTQISALFRREGTEYGTIPALQLVCLWAIKGGYGVLEETVE